MMKVAINNQHGGFGISDLAFERLLDLKGVLWQRGKRCDLLGCMYYQAGHLGDDKYYISPYNYHIRTDPDLIKIIEDLGEASWGRYSEIVILEIPDDIEWYIEEYDGLEHVAEVHRTWYGK